MFDACRTGRMSQPKKINCQATTMESLQQSGVEPVKSLVNSSTSPVNSKATTEWRGTATDYAAIFDLHEEAAIIHISGDTIRKMQNAEREHHINATLIDNGEIRRRMSMIPAKFESKFQEFLRKETESEKNVCLQTFRKSGSCQIDQYDAVPLPSRPRRVHVTIDPAVQIVSNKRSVSRLIKLCLNKVLSIYIIHRPNCTHLFVFFLIVLHLDHPISENETN